MTLSRVLVAEDDPDIQTVIRMSLKLKGVKTIIITDNGEDCLKQVDEVHPDVILLDVMMPRLDGYQTCAKLKSNPVTQNIPVIFLTAKAQVFEQKKGMDAGALGYLIKPFDPMTLFDQVVALLNQKK